MAANLGELQSLTAELDALLASAGFRSSRPRQREVRAGIAEVARSIAPLPLHPHLRWFWDYWPAYGHGLVRPSFVEPAHGLELRDNWAMPRSIIPIAGETNVLILADLTGADAPVGPRIYAVDTDRPHAQLIFAGVADLLRYVIVLAETTEMSDTAAQADDGLELLGDRERLVAWLPPSVSEHDKAPVDLDDARTWPAAWRN